MYQLYRSVSDKNTVDTMSTGFSDIFRCFVLADEIERVNREKARRAKMVNNVSKQESQNKSESRSETNVSSQNSQLQTNTKLKFDYDNYDW